MARAAIQLVVALSAVWVSGCGTVGNCWSCCSSGDRTVYGGVVKTVKLAGDGVNEAAKLDSPLCPLYLVGSACFLAVDVPLSLIGDTLTLPWTIPATFNSSHPPERDRIGYDRPELPRAVESAPGKTMIVYDARLKD
jgi:uncharacterized protein YceK